MREAAFIKQNKEKWLTFEQAIFGKAKKNPDEMASLYVQLVNDLSYAQTFYPKSKVTKYLNYLASQIYQKVYKTKREDTNRLVYFFKTEVPMIVYEYRRYVLYAFVLFFVFVGIGVFSAKYDDGFVRLIMGDQYVNMTLQNIKEGDPVAVYKSGSNWGGFIAITFNNLFVGLKSFFYGIFLGLGTIWVLLQNCIMLGSFQYFFYEQGYFWESVRGIWIHGSMEIFAIVIEASAGFVLGASILFPKTYSRFDSFKIGFKNGLKIVLATMPFTFMAGFLEGFVTRYSQVMPNWLNVVIILGTLFLISYYFLIYPFIVNKKIKMMFQLYKKRSFGDMISDTFTFLKMTGKHFFKNYFSVLGIFLLVFLVLTYFVSKVYFDFIFASINSSAFGDNPMESFFGDSIVMIVGVFILFLLLLIFISLLNYSFPVSYFRLYEKHNNTTNFTSKDVVNEMKSTFGKLIIFFLITILIGILFFVLLMVMFSLVAVVSPFLVLFVMIPIFVVIPIVYIWITQTLYYQMNSELGIFASLVQGWNSMANKFWPTLSSTIIIYIIITILGYIVSMIPYIIGMVSVFGAGTTDPFQNTDSLSFFGIMMTITMVLSILMSFISYNLLFINQGLIYYSTVEQKENRTPQSEIDLIGKEEF